MATDDRLPRLVARRLVLAAALAGMLAGAALAQGGRVGWDGTWAGGWQGNAGVQLTFVGDKLISFYWRDDYKDILRVAASPDGVGKTFAWAGGEAMTMTRRDAAGNAFLLVREPGRRDIQVVQLKRE
jgi:hypothetical protein